MQLGRDWDARLDGTIRRYLRYMLRIAARKGELFGFELRRLRIGCCFLLIEGRWRGVSTCCYRSCWGLGLSGLGRWSIDTYVPSYSSSYKLSSLSALSTIFCSPGGNFSGAGRPVGGGPRGLSVSGSFPAILELVQAV